MENLVNIAAVIKFVFFKLSELILLTNLPKKIQKRISKRNVISVKTNRKFIRCNIV